MKKTVLGFAFLVVLSACSSRNRVDDRPRVAQEDPYVAIAERENYKFYKQDIQQMYNSKKLPSINFDFDSIRPPEYAYPFMDKVVALLNEKPQLHLILEGHSDSLGSEEYNYWLSGARASAMKSYMVSRGIQADRIRVHAHGNKRPISLDKSPSGRRANRRVDFKLTTRRWKSIF